MFFYLRVTICAVSLLVLTMSNVSLALAQRLVSNTTVDPNSSPASSATASSRTAATITLYYDPVQGSSSIDLVRRALLANGELGAARLDVERARARLRQAGLTPNPTVDFEQSTGRFTGSPDERETSVGFAVPVELGGKRKRRVDLAQAEIEAAEAEIADRERRLVAEVRANYAEALAALRELQITGNLNDIDLQTTRFVQARVNEGESAPIEVSLLRVEVDRLRSRRALVEGKLKASLLKLKSLAGISPADALRLREDLESPVLSSPPASLEVATEIALRERPDLKLARLNEEVAQAGLQLAKADGTPDVTPFIKYSVVRSEDETLPAAILKRDKLLSFGVSIGIPVFNRNQGAKADASMAISQATKRREFLEQLVQSEVASAYERYEAARAAIQTYNSGVIARSNENIRAIRAAYQIGEFRITDLLVEQRRLLDSQREFIEALTEQYRALADLEAAIGVAKH